MALATKCPHCHTVFKVAHDQLKLRGGIVRCGACNEIFDGNAALVEQAFALPVTPLIPPAPAAPLDFELELDDVIEPAEEVPAPAAEPAQEPPDERREPNFDMPSEHIVAVALDDLHHFDDVDNGFETAAPAETPEPVEADRIADEAAAADLLTAAPESALLAAGATHEEVAEDDEEPEFVRQAARRERAGRAARLAMIAGIPLLAVALLLQGAWTLRNGLAANYPALKPALSTLCIPLGCKVELPHQIDALAVEQGELQTLAPATFSYVTVLRNQSRSVQAWPHVELVLNDGADKPVLRRVFAPRDYLPGPDDAAQGFRPRSEQSIKLYFQVNRLEASGYHIAIFYP